MHPQQASRRESPGKIRKACAPSAPPAELAPEQAAACDTVLLQQRYQALIREHLDQLLDPLFAEFTGLHFRVAWAPAPPRLWQNVAVPTGGSACCQFSSSPLLPDCRTCGSTQFSRALKADNGGHRFTCWLGVRNWWFPIRIRGQMLGIAYLQALARPAHRPPGSKPSAGKVGMGRSRESARVLAQGEFARAARLLRLIVLHVQTASLADLRKADLTEARHVVLALEKEQARLQKTLVRDLPPCAEVPRGSATENHAEQLVHHLLECIELNFQKPITLRHCAANLGMNPAYLSDLFSQKVGVPFKTYLTELRLEKAKQMLSDPAKTASEVAYATGYASENRFRIAFKRATGLSPRTWRESLRLASQETASRPGEDGS